jgi:hypothetical protein
MNTHRWQTVAILGLILAAVAAPSQSNQAMLKADIPFAFAVDNHMLPAGHYQLSPLDQRTIRIENSSDHGTFMRVLNVQRRNPQSTGKLIFHRYGDRYFLAQIWAPNTGVGKQLYKSRAEEEQESVGINRYIAELRADK